MNADIKKAYLKFLLGNMTQEDGYVYRGFVGTPVFLGDRSIVFHSHLDSIFINNGLTKLPTVSFSPYIDVASDHSVGQLETELLLSREYLESALEDVEGDKLFDGCTLIKVKRDAISNSFFTNGKAEVMFEGDVIIPKGSYEFNHVFEYDSEIYILPEKEFISGFNKREYVEDIKINQENPKSYHGMTISQTSHAPSLGAWQPEDGHIFLEDYLHSDVFREATSVDNSLEPINIYAGANQHPELSNFAIRPFASSAIADDEGRDMQFQSVEQAYQFSKTLFSSRDVADPELVSLQKQIMATTDGSILRNIGRVVPQVDVASWDARKKDLMRGFIRESFAQNPEAQKALLATGKAPLTHMQDRSSWREDFPKILMEVRSYLQERQDEQHEKTLVRNEEFIKGIYDTEEIYRLESYKASVGVYDDIYLFVLDHKEGDSVQTVVIGKDFPQFVLSAKVNKMNYVTDGDLVLIPSANFPQELQKPFLEITRACLCNEAVKEMNQGATGELSNVVKL